MTRCPNLVLLFSTFMLSACATAPMGGAGGQPDTLIRDVTVLPMTGGAALQHYSVLVRNGRIAALEPAASLAEPAGVRVIDGEGRYLIPGLIDSHIHVANGTGDAQDAAWRQMILLLANGVTTARSLSGSPSALALRERIRSGELTGPDLLLAGPSLNFNSVQTPEAATAAVHEQAAAGFDFLKTHGVTSDVYEALVAASREVRIPLVGHVVPDFGLKRALAAGQQVEHLDGYLAELIPSSSGIEAPGGQFFYGPELDAIDPGLMSAVARRTVDAGVWNSPTLALFEIVAEDDPSAIYSRWPEMSYVSESEATRWAADIDGIRSDAPPADRAVRYIQLRRGMTRALRDAGAGLMAGSDSPQLFMVPGFSLHRELRALQNAGLTPFEALRTGTSAPGEYLQRWTRTGTIEVGNEADLVLLHSDPLQDVANAADIDGVMSNGRWFSATDLDAMLLAVRRSVGR